MSREIKFRAWCEGTHDGMTFSEPHMETNVIVGAKGGYLSIESGWDIYGEYPTIPVMQYTGLKDKNGSGVETYEGDIVQRRDGKRGEVIWHQDSCGFAIAFGDDEPLGSLSSWFEVVGNKWES